MKRLSIQKWEARFPLKKQRNYKAQRGEKSPNKITTIASTNQGIQKPTTSYLLVKWRGKKKRRRGFTSEIALESVNHKDSSIDPKVPLSLRITIDINTSIPTRTQTQTLKNKKSKNKRRKQPSIQIQKNLAREKPYLSNTQIQRMQSNPRS